MNEETDKESSESGVTGFSWDQNPSPPKAPPGDKTTTENLSGGSATSRDYSTLMLVGKINSFLGWIVVVGGVNGVFVGFAQGNFAILTIAFPGLFAAIIGLLIVASGQMISCLVSTERNSKDTSEILGQHTEILRQIASNTETKAE